MLADAGWVVQDRAAFNPAVQPRSSHPEPGNREGCPYGINLTEVLHVV
jgi:hypothetical protein